MTRDILYIVQVENGSVEEEWKTSNYAAFSKLKTCVTVVSAS